MSPNSRSSMHAFPVLPHRVRTLLRLALLALVLGAAGLARAGCGTIITFNPTDHWAWITIYDLAKTTHMDYGYVAPHGVRSWTAGASVLKFACGSFYHVRAEVKQSTDPKTQPPGDPPNIFDTNVQINPQLTLADAFSLLKSIGTALSCVDASCLVKWGINQAAGDAMFGPIGKNSTDSVVCLATLDNKSYWWEHSSACGKIPDRYLMLPLVKVVTQGSASDAYVFQVMKNGKVLDPAGVATGTFSVDNPAVAVFADPHSAQFKPLKPGRTAVHWTLDGQPRGGALLQVK